MGLSTGPWLSGTAGTGLGVTEHNGRKHALKEGAPGPGAGEEIQGDPPGMTPRQELPTLWGGGSCLHCGLTHPNLINETETLSVF